jgi:serine/threonine protein kinase
MDSLLGDDEFKETQFSNSEAIYARPTTTRQATFDHFELIKVIGRGTFGKVYLVRCTLDNRFHAMKCIRKDVVIEHESVESLKVERLILSQVNHPFIIGLDYVF